MDRKGSGTISQTCVLAGWPITMVCSQTKSPLCGPFAADVWRYTAVRGRKEKEKMTLSLHW